VSYRTVGWIVTRPRLNVLPGLAIITVTMKGTHVSSLLSQAALVAAGLEARPQPLRHHHLVPVLIGLTKHAGQEAVQPLNVYKRGVVSRRVAVQNPSAWRMGPVEVSVV